GVVDQDVDASAGADHGPDHPHDLVLVADIDGNGQRVSARRSDGAGCRLRRFLIDLRDHHTGPLGGEGLGDGQADAVSGTGDDRDLTLETASQPGLLGHVLSVLSLSFAARSSSISGIRMRFTECGSGMWRYSMALVPGWMRSRTASAPVA